MRSTALTLAPALLLAACGTFTSAERREAADSHSENALSYYEGKDYARSLDQIERGLREQSDHYQLNQLKGRIFIEGARAGNPKLYQKALEQFEYVRDLRRSGQHDYKTWLGLGEANQGLYQMHRKEARKFRREAKTEGLDSVAKSQLLAKADEHRRLCERHMAQAEQYYRSLTKSEELGAFPAHERLFILEMDKAIDLTDPAERRAQLQKAAREAEGYLAQNSYRQKHYEVMVGLTGDIVQEKRARRLLKAFKAREMNFRATYANLLYDLGEFAKAKEQLDQVLDIDPMAAPNYFNRARCLAKLDEAAAAKRDLQHFLRLTKQPFDSAQVQTASTMLRELDG